MTQNEWREYYRKRCSEHAESAFYTLDDAMLDINLALEYCAPTSLKKAWELVDQAMKLLEEVRDGGCW